MENSKKQNGNLGVNKIGKNIRRNYFQRTIDFGNNIITSGRHHYPEPKVHHIHKDDFKSFVQHFTGKNSIGSNPPTEFTRLQRIRPPPLSIVRPPVQVPVAPPEAPIADNSWTNFVESPISAFMRDFQNSTMNFDNSRGNQFHPYPSQSQVLNNVNVQSQPIIQSQPQNYPMNGSNQLMNGFPSSQTNSPQSPTTEYLLSSPTSNMNFLSLECPFYQHLQNGISSSGPPSPLSATIFPSFASPKRPDNQ